MTADPTRHVSFASLCSIIPEEQSPQASGIFGLHTKSISLHIGWPATRRSNSEASIPDDTAAASGPSKTQASSNGSRSPTLVVRIPSFTTKHRQPSHSPTTETHPIRSCIKQRNASFSTPPARLGPVSPSRTPSSPPTPQRQRSLSTPIETTPLRPCCTECEEPVLLARSLGLTYKVPWSNAARAKKKRDDAEEQRDILAGLKEGCILKWAQLKDQEDTNIEEGLLSPNCSIIPSLSVCSSASSDASDPLSQLDGMHKSAGLRKRHDPNDDWAPSKYYDDDDDEVDLFPLPSPSPKLTPPEGASPSTSCINLPSPAPTQLAFPGSDNPSLTSPRQSDQPSYPPPPPSAYSNQLGLGLPTILSAPASRSGSRSSISSHSSAKPSPLRSSSHVPESGDLAPGYRSDHVQHGSDSGCQPLRKQAPSVASTRSSTTASSRNSSSRVWTSSFMPPPLPSKSTHSHRTSHSTSSTSKSALTPSHGVSPSPLTTASSALSSARSGSSTRPLQASSSLPIVISERSDPPYMPTYTGTQREVVVIKSSNLSSSKRKERDAPSKDRQPSSRQPSHPFDPTPPPVPAKSTASSDISEGMSTPTAAPSVLSSGTPSESTGYVNHGKKLSATSTGLKKASSMPPLPVPDDAFNQTSRRGGHAAHSRVGPLTRTAGAGTELVINREGGSPLTKTTSMISNRSSPGRNRQDSDEAAGDKGARSRSSSIRKMFKGMSLGMGSAAGVVPVR